MTEHTGRVLNLAAVSLLIVLSALLVPLRPSGAGSGTLTTREGFVALRGRGPTIGTSGTLRRYSVEVQPGTGWSAGAFSNRVEGILSYRKSWTRRGDWRLRRVEPRYADVRVVLAKPATVDRYCARAGLDTNGYYSCWNGTFAMINVNRWNHGTPRFSAGLATYRGYLINHEVGHGLGYHHRTCPGPRRLAPVMMQQSKGTAPCEPNPYPYPR